MDERSVHQKKRNNDTNLKKDRCLFKIHLANTRYDLIRKIVENSKYWIEAPPDSNDWDVMWIDTSMSEERFRKLKKFQKINHFIGMRGISRKDELSKNLKKLKKKFPLSYNFFPLTWTLPNEISNFKDYYEKNNCKTYIVKLKNSCQGKGIYLTKKLNNLNVYESCIIQKYVHKPLLINDLKFDIRLYVLVTGCDPLRIFIHEDGLVRFSIEKYKLPKSKNLKQLNMHLTNFAINKKSDKFEDSLNPDDATIGHKRSWKVFLQKLKEQKLPMDSVVKNIEYIIIKTICSIQPELKHYYNSAHINDYSNSMCFEILGFDILIDHKLKPWLLEVNHSPSFTVSSMVDERVKNAVIKDTLNILYMRSKYRLIHIQEHANLQIFRKKYSHLLEKNKKELKEKLTISRFQYENNNLGGYKRIYPSEELLDYENIILYVSNLWNKSIGIPHSIKKDSFAYLFDDKMKRKEQSKDILSVIDTSTNEEQSLDRETASLSNRSINKESQVNQQNLEYSKYHLHIHHKNASNCSTSC